MRRAKALCNGGAADAVSVLPQCPVLEECREWALEVRFPHGIIGGLSERERKKILKERDERRG